MIDSGDLRQLSEMISKSIEPLRHEIAQYIKHQEEICRIRHAPVDVHLAEGLMYRDKVQRMSARQALIWSLVLLLLTTGVGSSIMVWHVVKTLVERTDVLQTTPHEKAS